MNKFVETIRLHRNDEIEAYKDRGYLFGKNRNRYEFVRKIRIDNEEEYFNFQVRVDFKEVRFYLLGNEDSTVEIMGYLYFSIYEIYRMLKIISLVEGVDFVVDILNSYLKSTTYLEFQYDDERYKFKMPNITDVNGEIELSDATLSITYKELYLLISLIQEKSNYLFSKSEDGELYQDGIVRLMIALLKQNEDNDILKNIGWNYNLSEDKFILNKEYVSSKNERESKRYYLTKLELSNILQIES
ncbi:hypothetical protein QE109_04620 [Fusibacter bizertensis]|uniref:Uncharacterized protein n=1 Tax=Fusibacter bizertensis TaxID=1488331 RepID=A0ABT6NAI0_9FIRM|nr:hypothetical protein [Fusibacter bizertensis]MDH8677417.1 hypothetical protein [Fusibacter bizertensis]